MRPYLERPIGDLPPGYAAAYDQTSLWGAMFGLLMLDELELRRGIDGLDVGCATGFPLLELAQMHGPTSRFVGIDVWSEALERARQKITVLGLDHVRVEEADAVSMPFDDRSFDLITSNLGLNNFAHPQRSIAECARVSRGGARLVLTTNVTGHLSEMYMLLREIAGNDAAMIERIDAQETHRGSLETITQLLNDGGFEVVRSVERRFELRFAGVEAFLRHSLVQWFIDGWREAIGAEHEKEVFAEVERRLAERSPLKFGVPGLYVEGVRG